MWGAASFLFRCARCSGPAAVALIASPFLLRVGAPPRPWGGGGPRLWLPCCGGCGGGGGWGGRPPARPRVCVGGGGGLGEALWSPGDASRRPGGRGGGGMAVLAPGGRALLPPPSVESRILAQALAGAPHPPAVVARRWPAGGGREG